MNSPESALAMERLNDHIDATALDAMMREAGVVPPPRPATRP